MLESQKNTEPLSLQAFKPSSLKPIERTVIKDSLVQLWAKAIQNSSVEFQQWKLSATLRLSALTKP